MLLIIFFIRLSKLLYLKARAVPPPLIRVRPKKQEGGPLRNFSKNNKIIKSRKIFIIILVNYREL